MVIVRRDKTTWHWLQFCETEMLDATKFDSAQCDDVSDVHT